VAPARTAPPPVTPPAAPTPSAYTPPEEAHVPRDAPNGVFGHNEPVYPDGEVTRDRRADLLIDEPTGADDLVDALPDAPSIAEPDDPTFVRIPPAPEVPSDGPGAAFEPPGGDPFAQASGGAASIDAGIDGSVADVGSPGPGDDELEPLEPLGPSDAADEFAPLDPLDPSDFGDESTPLEPLDASELASGERDDPPSEPAMEFRDEIRAPSPFVRSADAADSDTDFAQAWPPPPDSSDAAPPADDFEIGSSWELESGDLGPTHEQPSDAAPPDDDGPTFETPDGPVEVGVEPDVEDGLAAVVPAPLATESDPEAPAAAIPDAEDGEAPARAARPSRDGGVDDLVASVLGHREGDAKPRAEPRTAEVRPPRDAAAAAVAPPWERGRSSGAPAQPVTFGDGDPFAADDEEPAAPELMPAPISPRQHEPVSVQAHDNQLHLRLQGTGAIAESGQVRELDIQVPVPGSWVGNRRVTLQLRLTLMPASEDEDGGEG
jgi:hypothetical protein